MCTYTISGKYSYCYLFTLVIFLFRCYLYFLNLPLPTVFCIFNVGKRRTDSYDSLPEWMTDGPSSQLETIELKGFNKEIEEERSGMYSQDFFISNEL